MIIEGLTWRVESQLPLIGVCCWVRGAGSCAGVWCDPGIVCAGCGIGWFRSAAERKWPSAGPSSCCRRCHWPRACSGRNICSGYAGSCAAGRNWTAAPGGCSWRCPCGCGCCVRRWKFACRRPGRPCACCSCWSCGTSDAPKSGIADARSRTRSGPPRSTFWRRRPELSLLWDSAGPHLPDRIVLIFCNMFVVSC